MPDTRQLALSRTLLSATITPPSIIHFCTKGGGAASLLEMLSLPDAAELEIASFHGNTLTRLLAASPRAQKVAIEHLVYRQFRGAAAIPASVNNSVTGLEISHHASRGFNATGSPTSNLSPSILGQRNRRISALLCSVVAGSRALPSRH
ncbi:hypothetical protein BOTBODRAFT_352605 [Botryobasidium botryosum FD-172 SS1]|uniref:Uncharacterized protein n=1 Tax=Botryobasidium botryosum (strain FD-172 SS1) TaxID=930990 RepID=A0A067MHI2_BOTB1|nr:hypothetical protein BOTBODRAFT_352605 [Botryobasidium botryosum FD-172 SS1]